MTDTVIIFGPPGTGKTEFLLQVCRHLLSQGVPQEVVAFTTFQKSAAQDAAYRAGVHSRDYRRLWYRTLHSICYRLLGLDKDRVVTPGKLKEFSDIVGGPVDARMATESDEMADLAQVMLGIRHARSGDNESKISSVMSLYQLSRLLCRTKDELMRCRDEPHPVATGYLRGFVDMRVYRALIRKYEDWKGGELCDFVDMLDMVLSGAAAIEPTWEYVFIDEAQDLSGIQWAVVEKLFFSGPKQTYMAGDDCQAIMSFQGARARDFLSYRKDSTVVHLRQTHRFGKTIVDLADKIAQRITEREPKEVWPADIESTVNQIYKFNTDSYPKGSKFLLHRHVVGCKAIAMNLLNNGIPFRNERGINPLARSSEILGYRAIQDLKKNGQIDGGQAASLVNMVPSYRTLEDSRIPIIRRGSKKKLKEMPPDKMLTRADLVEHFTEHFWGAIDTDNWGITKVKFPAYYEAVEAKGWNLLGGEIPEITITTIHGSKGRDADHVFLWNEVLPKCLMDENEHRLSYVGATRAKYGLWVVHQPVTGWNTTHYQYPI